MKNYEAPHRAMEPVIDYGSFHEYEESLWKSSAEGAKKALAFVYSAASRAMEETFKTAGDVTGEVFDTLSTVAPAPIASRPGSSIEGGANS